MKRFFLIFITLFGFSIYSVFNLIETTKAAGEFITSYNVKYSITPDGRSHVVQNIELTNQTTQFFANKFNLTIGVLKAENLKAYDSFGDLIISSKFENNITTIKVNFLQKIVGLGKRYKFTIEYDTPELATKIGQIWEVNIPRLASSEFITNYDLILQVPNEFGPLAFITPKPINTSELKTSREFKFNKEQLVKSGVSASFGEKQIFDFELKYHLENPNLAPAVTEIALPPDTNYQKVVYDQLIPKPLDVRVDNDGNWLAKYKLTGKQKIEITAKGQVQILPKPIYNTDFKLNPYEKSIYLTPQPFWETDNSTLTQKAKELKTAKNIYDFVSDYLSYNEKRLTQKNVKRHGASLAYSQPQNSVCMEFTDLFITLARAAGIPAREINGFAYTANERLRPLSLTSLGSDVLHAWPEYWDDDKGWIQIDPTWANTSGGVDYFSKLDFNHFTFARKGITSQTPLPAGAYKLKSSIGKDVKISIADKLVNVYQDVYLNSNIPDRIISGLPIKAKITLQNKGNEALYGSVVKIEASGVDLLTDKSIPISILPPFATEDLELSFINRNLFSPQKAVVSIYFGDKTEKQEIFVQPAIIIYSAIGLILIILFSSVIFVGYKIYRRDHKIG